MTKLECNAEGAHTTRSPCLAQGEKKRRRHGKVGCLAGAEGRATAEKRAKVESGSEAVCRDKSTQEPEGEGLQPDERKRADKGAMGSDTQERDGEENLQLALLSGEADG